MDINVSNYMQLCIFYGSKQGQVALPEYEMLLYERICGMLQVHAKYIELYLQLETYKLEKHIEGDDAKSRGVDEAQSLYKEQDQPPAGN